MARKSPVLVRPHIPKASTRLERPEDAIADINEQLDTTRLAGVMLCCATSYDFDALGPAIDAAFDCPVLAVASEGELHFGHDQQSIVGIGFPSALFEVQALYAWPVAQTSRAAAALKTHNGGVLDTPRHIGLVCFDGQSEQLESLLSLGSAFENLAFAGAATGKVQGCGRVYDQGGFKRDHAVCMVMASRVSFEVFSIEVEAEEQNVADYQRLVHALKKRMPDILFTLGFEGLLDRQTPALPDVTIADALNTLNLSGFSTSAQLVRDGFRARGISGVVFGA